jgi:hypothetical protein
MTDSVLKFALYKYLIIYASVLIKDGLMAPKSVPIAPKPTWIRYKKGFPDKTYMDSL